MSSALLPFRCRPTWRGGTHQCNAQSPGPTRTPVPWQARHKGKGPKTDPSTPGSTKRGKNLWDEPAEVFTAMGTSGLVVALQDGELRAADELSLWGVVNKTESLAEMDAPVQETEGAARKRKIAKMAYNRALGRLETHEHALKKAAQAKQDGVEDEDDDEDKDEDEDEV